MKVFLGSPFKGLKRIRKVLHDELATKHEIIWMEDFGSQELDALRACFRAIEESNVYLLLFGASYGTRLPDSDYSYTHLEYEHAERTGTPVIAYVQRLAPAVRRDPHSEDFLAQAKSSHLLEYDEFDSPDELFAFAWRDLARFQERLERPKFSGTAPVSDEGAYALGAFRRKVLTAAPFPVTIVDAGAVADRKYRPDKRGRIGDKVASVVRVAGSHDLPVQTFNDFPVKRKGDVVQRKAARINENSRLIVILVPKETVKDVVNLFDDARCERVVFHGDWFDVAAGDYYIETYSDPDLTSCELRAAVLELIEQRVMSHVVEQTT